MLSLIAALIAAGLYGNIGIKVFYNNILMDIFSAPPLVTRGGKIFYACIVPVWWIIGKSSRLFQGRWVKLTSIDKPSS